MNLSNEFNEKMVPFEPEIVERHRMPAQTKSLLVNTNDQLVAKLEREVFPFTLNLLHFNSLFHAQT